MLPHPLCVLVLAPALAPGGAPVPDVLRPLVARGELECGATQLAPLATRAETPAAFLRLGDGSALEFEGGKARWRAEGAPAIELPLPALEEPTIVGRGAASTHVCDARAPQRVWRLDHRARTVRPLAQLERPDHARERPIAIVEHAGATFALLAPWAPDVVELGPPGAPSRLVAWNDEGAELWSLHLGGGVAQGLPGVFLSAARGPVAWGSAPIVLQADGESLLASAAGGAELLRVGLDGAVRARLERVWEFERGFVGPSVWSHHLARFGLEGFEARERGVPETLARDAAYRAALERARATEEALVCGGPVVVGERVFVAVAAARPGAWSAYLGRGRVYELGADLTPLGVVDLPAVPRGSLAVACDEAVVWALPHDGLVRLAATPRADLWGIGPGGWDRVLRVAWLREALPAQRAVWLGTDPAWSGVLFADGFALSTPEGGFVADERERVFRFPLRRVRLADGAERALELRVPFEGELKRPETNYQTSGQGLRTFGPYGLGLTGLERVGPRLVVRVATEASAAVLEFELARVLAD